LSSMVSTVSAQCSIACAIDLHIVRLRLRPGWSSWRTRAAATSSSRRKRDSRSSRSCLCPTLPGARGPRRCSVWWADHVDKLVQPVKGVNMIR
jgi:hypothetical protein